MTDLKHTVKWYVSLSNGETFFEGKGEYEDISGLKSPWQRLYKYIIENNLEITSFGLYSKNRRWNLVSSGNRPKFKAFENAKKPYDFQVERTLSRELDKDSMNVVEHYTVARAIYPNYELQIWVNNQNPDVSWSFVKEDI